MTQAEARNAVRHLQCQVEALKTLIFLHSQPQFSPKVHTQIERVLDEILDDIVALNLELADRKTPTPNCRPATREELEALCQGGNVVMFPAVA